jgi:hypothetical protein
MRLRRTAIFATTVLTVLGCAPAAFADTGNARNAPIIGDVTGDHINDRSVLGKDATGCTVTVEPGKARGGYGAAVIHHYLIPGSTVPTYCPDMGVAVYRSAKTASDLAVTWFSGPIGGASNAYVLRNFTVLSGAAGQSTPSYVGTADFDGDGHGDLWESSDESSSFETFIRHGKTFEAGPASFFSIQPLPSFVLGDLDRKRGTDIAAGYLSPMTDQVGLPGSAGSGALLVFGKSGKKVLLEHDATGSIAYVPSIVDANGDAYLDVRVSGGPAAPRTYLNDGHNHFTLVV